MPSYIVTANNDLTAPYQHRAFKGETLPLSIDLSPWADQYGVVTTATWNIQSGTATLSNQTLVANVATTNVTIPDEGSSLLRLIADTASGISKVVYVTVRAVNPTQDANDYI
jgi:hypothetical protein